MDYSPPVETVSFHVWQPCNMHCKFCFATFNDVRSTVLPAGHLTRSQALEAVELLVLAGFRKVTFAGGEPFLCPWLDELVRMAKQHGAQTCVVTNGSLLSAELLRKYEQALDWLVLSVDSLATPTLREIGRMTRGRPMDAEKYLALCRLVDVTDVSLRVNTVVSRANLDEDLSEFIRLVRPVRWKVMQVLPVRGQNSGKVEPYLVSDEEFEAYVARHRPLVADSTALIVETNDDLIGSYAMLDPAGRFFDNTRGCYHYSESILDVGVPRAISQVSISRAKFVSRGGHYYLPVT
ncbi:viperin family antiviral radical SAM protein [Micromonospora sp. CPCC 205539]|uniref:viperin family antiviral radical SAM protein n=1 Tax=Micromonospora sp. CPCC 205539 TaxID=3122408 RepID=UPI002FF40507